MYSGKCENTSTAVSVKTPVQRRASEEQNIGSRIVVVGGSAQSGTSVTSGAKYITARPQYEYIELSSAEEEYVGNARRRVRTGI